jgi:NADH-quinone oxidoreductase subunit E
MNKFQNSTLEGKKNLIKELQRVQEEQGYISEEMVERIAETLDVFSSQIFGVATFYSRFRLTPAGKFLIHVCHGTACHVKGGRRILDALCEELGVSEGEITPDGNFTVERVYCLGSCSLAPVVSVNERIYGRMSRGKVRRLVKELRAEGKD